MALLACTSGAPGKFLATRIGEAIDEFFWRPGSTLESGLANMEHPQLPRNKKAPMASMAAKTWSAGWLWGLLAWSCEVWFFIALTNPSDAHPFNGVQSQWSFSP